MARRRAVKPEAERAPHQRYPYSGWVQRLNKVFPPRGGFIEPLSEDWRNARRGRLTASKRAEIIYNRRPAEWNALADELEKELSPDYQWTEITGNRAMDWGREHEKEALGNIMLDYGFDVIDPGLRFDREHPWIAATPDGWHEGSETGELTTVQIKCPYLTKNHLDTLYTRSIKPVYYYQVQWEAMVSQARLIEFYSYDPRQPLATRLVRLPIERSEEVIDKLRRHALEFGEMFENRKRMAEGKTTASGVILPYGDPA